MSDKELKKTGLELMREPFPENQISILCRSTKKDNPKGKCQVCGGWHGLPAIGLNYVGHAALTNRLLDCDPNWIWEPVAFDAMGHPAIDSDGGMWIKLTVCGVTRYGYGDAQGKVGGDAMKERIGDALRNAAMRFGAALDLWHKGDLHVDEEEEPQNVKPKPPQPPTTKEATAKDAEYHDRCQAALKTIFVHDRDAALNHVERLTTFTGKDGKEVPGVRDYRKLAGKRLEILVHNLEKEAKEFTPPETPTQDQEDGEPF